MILVLFFSEDNILSDEIKICYILILSDEIKICYILEYQSNKNQAFLFFGTPGIFVYLVNVL